MRYVLLFFILISQTLFCFAADFNVTKLPNGQTVIIQEIHDNPIVTLDTWVRTGSINEDDKNNGVSHFLEHLFFKGTEKHPAGEFDKIMESKGAIVNAATSKDYTHYYITLPSKDFDLALDMHADMLLNPAIPAGELERERKVVLEEISRSNDVPTTKLYDNLNSAFYKQHPYKRKVLGTTEIISNIKREEIFDYYNKHYSPDNMVTVITGDVNTADTLKKVRAAFNSKKRTKQNNIKTVKEALPSCKQEITDTADIQNSYLLIGFRTTDIKNRKDVVALDLLATVLGDGKTSRLYQNIKEKKRLAFSISAGNSSMKDDGMFFISANYKPEDYIDLKNNILQEIEKLKKIPVSEQELNKAKNMIERDTLYSRESVSEISQELGYTAVVWNDINFYNGYLPLAKTVTSKQLMDVAKKYLDENKMVISVLNPKNGVVSNAAKTDENEILVSSKKLTPVTEKDTVSEYKLANGASMVVNQNKSNDIIAIQIFSKGGTFLDKKAGTGELTAAGMLRGTSKYSYEELMNILEENGIKLGIKSGSDVLAISVKCTKNELPIVFDALYEIINNAKFDDREIEKIKTEKLAAIKKQRDNPMNVAFEEFKSKIWGNVPYSYTGLTYEKTFPEITQKDLKEFYSNAFYPENIVISVNGNVDENLLGQNFEKIFHSKNGKKVEISDFGTPLTLLEETKEIKKSKKTEAAWLVLGWRCMGLKDLKEYATLKVIDSLLGTGMSSRMFRHLREVQGLAYQVGSTYGANMNEGVFAVYIGTNPKNIETAKKEMLNEIGVLMKEFVPEEELKTTKEKILDNYLLSFETNMEKANTFGWYKTAFNDWQFYEKYAELINGVTQSDIINVANKYFSQPYLYVQVSE